MIIAFDLNNLKSLNSLPNYFALINSLLNKTSREKIQDEDDFVTNNNENESRINEE